MLKSLVDQESLDLDCEVIVIDNNSTDHTRAIVEEISRHVPIRYVYEARQGLSHARNRALKEFLGNYLLFADDDVDLAQGWLAAYREAMFSHCEADFFGGRILPEWCGNRPTWVGEKPLPLIDGLLCWLDLGDETRRFLNTESGPFGASFGLTRRLADRVGYFNGSLGCVGRARGRGEESDWIARARAKGAIGVYVANAVCFHRVDAGSLSLSGLFVYGVHSGRASCIMKCGDRDYDLLHFFSFAARGLWQLLRGRGDRFRQCVVNMGIVFGLKLAPQSPQSPHTPSLAGEK